MEAGFVRSAGKTTKVAAWHLTKQTISVMRPPISQADTTTGAGAGALRSHPRVTAGARRSCGSHFPRKMFRRRAPQPGGSWGRRTSGAGVQAPANSTGGMPPWLTATTRARAVAPRCHRAELAGCCTVSRRSFAPIAAPAMPVWLSGNHAPVVARS